MKAVVIGAGTGEYGKRFASGLFIEDSGFHVIVDISLSNVNLFPPLPDNSVFLTTHGHQDHFDPDHPWKTIYHENFTDFGGRGNEYRLFTTPGVVRYMRWWNGLEWDEPAMISFSGKNELSVIPVAVGERIVFGEMRIYPVKSGHFWSVNGIVDRDEAYGYAIYSPSGSLLYLPDFKFSRPVVDSIAGIVEREGRLDCLILGCPNPRDDIATDSEHSTISEIFRWAGVMEKEGLWSGELVLTHRNPNWDGENGNMDGVVVADHGTEITIQENTVLPSSCRKILQRT